MIFNFNRLCFLSFLLAATGQVALSQNSSLGWQDAIVPGGVIGEYRHGTFPSLDNNTHVGYDIVASCGTQIRAWKAGRAVDVIEKKNDPNFNSLGYMVLLEHAGTGNNGNEFSLYLHMKDAPKGVGKKPITKGTIVSQGDMIGAVGDTGVAQGCHLHFEARRFVSRFNPSWNNIYGPGDKRSDKVFLRDWIDPGRQTPNLTSAATPTYDANYVDPRGVVSGATRLPLRSVILIEDAKCNKDQLKTVSALIPRGLKCSGQIVYSGVTYFAFPNWMRSETSPGLMRIVVAGSRPQVLSDVAASTDGFVAPILVENQYLEFISVAPQARYSDKNGHPYLRYRVVGNAGALQLQLLPSKMFAKGQSPIDLNRRSLAAATAVNAPAPAAASSNPESASSGRVITGTSRSPADVFRDGNPALDRPASDRACGSIGQDGVISNVGDFFECDESAAVRALQTGRRIVFTPQVVSFSQGKFVARMSQHAEKVQAAKQRLDERESGRRSKGGYMDDFGIVVRARPFEMTCDFGPRQVGKGELVVTMAKLISFSGRSAVFDCK